MPPVAAEPPDTEVLDGSPFMRGEWPDGSIPLDVGLAGVAEALGDGAPLDSVTPETLLAIAFATSDLSRLLKITPMEFVGEWESAIDERAGLEDVGTEADDAFLAATAAGNTAAQRRAIDIIIAKDGKLKLASLFNEQLPGVAGGSVDCTAFPRLSKLAPGGAGQVPEDRIRALASQLQVELPESADLSEGARAKWVWGLSRLSRSVTARAVGWLGLAASDEDWKAALGELRRDGRFAADWMTAKRLERTANRARAEQRVAQGAGYDERVTNLEVWSHVSGSTRDAAADAALASQVARATTAMHQFNLTGADEAMMRITAGLAVKKVMKEKNQGLDRVDVAPLQADLALQHILGYVNPTVIVATPSSPARGGGADGGAGGGGGGGELRLDAASRTALERFGAAAAAGMPAASTTDKIILGKAPDERGVRRPEYFAAIDVAPFERHEAEIGRLSAMTGEAFEAGFAALADEARHLCAIPVHHLDLARNTRLLPLSLVYDAATVAGDNILIKGTVLAGEREGEEQKAEDRERAKSIAKLRVGNVLAGGPQLCVVAYKLDSIWTFLQVPYSSGKVAADINGIWDTAFMTWAEVAESQLGAECEIVPGVEKILQFVRKSSLTGHVVWPDQARCDYPGVALWFFSRDYRAYREKRLDKAGVPAAKPSLLAILTTSTDFLSYMRMALEWGGFGNANCRPSKQPYCDLRLGSAPPKGKRVALGVDALEDGDADEPPPSKRSTKRKSQKERKRDAERKKRPTDDRKPPADDRKPPKRQPAPGDKPPPHAGGGDKPQYGPRPQGSAWPNKKHMQTPDAVKVLQSKMDRSSGLDKGSCAACLLGPGVGCPADNRVGCEGKCGRSHQGPGDRKVQYCKDVMTTCGFDSPVYFNNPKFWTSAPSGHQRHGKAAAKKPAAGSPKHSSASEDDDGDGDDDDDDDDE